MDEVVQFTDSEREALLSELSGRIEEAGTLIDALITPSLTSPTALDRRRLAVTPESYEELVDPLGEALAVALRERLDDVEPIWSQMAQALYAMAETAREADLAGLPAATAAQVTAVYSLKGDGEDDGDGDIRAVLLEAPMPIDYLPGQSLPVLVPGEYGAPGKWHDLAPALPSNPFGQLVFYIPGSWREPEVGEYWTCGNARGEQVLFPDHGTVDATGSRLAGVRAAVFAGVDKRVELSVDAVGAREPGLTALAGAVDWLTLRRV